MIRPDFPDELIRFLLLLWLVCSIFAGLCAYERFKQRQREARIAWSNARWFRLMGSRHG